jgi:hypothetical protein
MEFPKYVPAQVQTFITARIEGSVFGYSGTGAALPVVETDCLQRLGKDPRMKDAFCILTAQFSDESKIRDFVYAAWAAQVNYTKYREGLKNAADLQKDIAKTSKKLALLLRKAAVNSSNCPLAFSSIRELLRHTDNHGMRGGNRAMWQWVRPDVLGDAPEYNETQKIEVPQGNGRSARPLKVITGVPTEETRNDLAYKWSMAPDLSDLLETLAQVADAYKPSEFGMIGAAIGSRQRNPKTEYLRAFGKLLTDVHSVMLTPAVMRAVAIAATVVLNLPDVDVTYDDVRKALEQPLKVPKN